MSSKLGRRDFLKIGALSACATAFRPIPPELGRSPVGLGRVTVSWIGHYSEPSFQSRRLVYIARDELIPLLASERADDGPYHNPLWYRTSGGYVHSGCIQTVQWNPQKPETSVREGGALFEVSVPYCRTYREPDTTSTPYYRLYYESTSWVEEVVQGGIPWKGEISKEMILSIFWPDNPVHDGAAIIQGDQIKQVAAILPLSRRDDLPSYYGTRHRAALGLTEATDALVIAVSEESGYVVIDKNSQLKTVKQKRRLGQILQEHMGVALKKSRESRKEKLVFIAAAIFSVVFTTGVWLSVSRGVDTLVTLQVPLEYTKRDLAMEIVKTSVNTVNLDLEGSGALIKSIRPDQVQVRLDLSKSKAGPNTFTISRKNISLPPGIVLKGVTPSVVDVDLDVLIKKELPVQIDWVGRLPDHFILAEANLEPQTVEIIGGKRMLEKMTTLYTEKVPINNLEVEGVITANVALNPASLKIAPGSEEKVTIRYQTRLRNQ